MSSAILTVRRAVADDPTQLIRATVDRLVAASARQRSAYAATLGLMRTDLLALHHIDRRDDITPAELAHVLLLSSGGTTAVIDRLARAGFVTRSSGSGGRRRVLLRITPEGRAVMAGPVAAMGADVGALVNELSASERESVERFLARLADRVERQADRLIDEGVEVTAATSGVPSPVLWG